METQLPNNSKANPERKPISTERLSEEEVAKWRAWQTYMGQDTICDWCKEPIDAPDEGQFEWIEFWSGPYCDSGGWDLQLVHTRPFCRFNRRKEYERDGGLVCQLSLICFRVPDGLEYLRASNEDYPLIQDFFMELIRRVFKLNNKEVHDESNLS